VITPRIPHVKYDYPFPVYSFKSVRVPYAEYRAGHPFTPFLVKKLKKLGIDIIHAHSPFTAMLLARQLRHYLRVPIVFTQHTKWDFDIAEAVPTKVLQKRIERLAYRNLSEADEMWAVSKGAGEHLVSRGYKGSYLVMPNGTDFSRSEPDPTVISKINSELNLSDGVPILLFVGRMM